MSLREALREQRAFVIGAVVTLYVIAFAYQMWRGF